MPALDPMPEPDVARVDGAAGTRVQYRRAARGAWVGIVGNLVLGVAKLAGGVLGTSTALVADALHSLSDSVSSVIVLWGLKSAGRPADKEHPFGHGKAEFVAARTVAILLIFIAMGLGYQAVTKILDPPEAVFPKPFTLWFVIASVVVKEGLFQYKIRLGRRVGSESLIADAWHHRSDAFSSLAALAGIAAAIVLGHEWRILDPIAALAIVGLLAAMGVKTFLRAGSALMDEAADEETAAAIRRAAVEVEGVEDLEKVMTRRSGLEIHAELHVEVDAEMPVGEAHDIATAVTARIRREVPGVTHVTVHVEPYVPGDH